MINIGTEIQGTYEFINRQGKKCKLIIEEKKSYKNGFGYLQVKEFYVDDTLIHSLENTESDCAKLSTRYDNENEKYVFALRLRSSALKNFIKYSNLNYKKDEAYIAIDNKELEAIYKELPKIREKQNEDIEEKLLRENLNRKIKFRDGDSQFYFYEEELVNSTTLKRFKNLLNNNDLNIYNHIGKFRVKENDGSYFTKIYYEFSINEIDELINILTDEINKIKLEKIRKENEADEKREAEINRLKTIARDTGEKQLYDSMTLPCSSKNEECNMDILYKYILPNGEFEEVRTHTW
ncbi:MAG: hypothetical protein ACRCYE_05190 [Sarcina sp.]